jgi:hypothetical protein
MLRAGDSFVQRRTLRNLQSDVALRFYQQACLFVK